MIDTEALQQLVLDGDHQRASGAEQQVIGQQVGLEMDILVVDLPEFNMKKTSDLLRSYSQLLRHSEHGDRQQKIDTLA